MGIVNELHMLACGMEECGDGPGTCVSAGIFGNARFRIADCDGTVMPASASGSLKYKAICLRIVEFLGPRSCCTAAKKKNAKYVSPRSVIDSRIHEYNDSLLKTGCFYKTILDFSTGQLERRQERDSHHHRKSKREREREKIGVQTYRLCSCQHRCISLVGRIGIDFDASCPPYTSPRSLLCTRTDDSSGLIA